MTSNLKSVVTRKGMTATSQRTKARPEQIKNAAGGYTFAVSDLDQIKRFLILGSEATYYQPGAEVTAENTATLRKVLATPEGARAVVDLIVEVSTQGRAAKQDYALFALALASDPNTSADTSYALSKLPAVARTATTLIQFVGFALQFRGWGRALKRAVAEWYTDKGADKAAFQAVKYRQRDGWTHRDLFRVSHPTTVDPAFQALGNYILKDEVGDLTPEIVKGFVLAQEPGADYVSLIGQYRLTWEMLPTEALNNADIWRALIDNGSLPLGALLRQLPRLTRLGLFEKLKDGSRLSAVVSKLTNAEEIERARIHPINVLIALRTYAEGRSQRGDSTWVASREIVDALDKAFYLAFKNVDPSGKKFLIGLDVSGSMGSKFRDPRGNVSTLSSRDISAALALVTVATEPETHVIGFTGGRTGYSYGYGRGNTFPAGGNGRLGKSVSDLDSAVDPNRRLDDVINQISGLPFGTTDCSLPMLYALENGLRPEVFLVITDNETYAGSMQPHEALEKYRRETGIDAKLIVMATSPSRNTITDPNDANSLDIVGFDSAAPQIVSAFARGEF
ncbi:Ro-like RNA binding protein [Microbacterium phage Zooman]|nr:Ro-like RNA binding protein [Microbacterium phage Zooman]